METNYNNTETIPQNNTPNQNSDE